MSTLRTTADQSRPTSPQPKIFGSLVRRFIVARNHPRRHLSLPPSRTTMAPDATTNEVQHLPPATAMLPAAPPLTGYRPKLSPPRSLRRRQQTPMLPQQPAVETTTDAMDLMDWLQEDCPKDLLPRVLAFAGPQTTVALSKTCRFWKEVIKQESTWRILCEELHKWKDGDELPASWRDLYQLSPCVPVDYSTVEAAYAAARAHAHHRSIRVLLRPGRYVVREALTLQNPRPMRVELATMEVPDSYAFVDQTIPLAESSLEPARKRKTTQSLRNILTCRSIDHVDEGEDDMGSTLEFFEPSMLSNSNRIDSPTSRSSSSSLTGPRKRATLLLRTRRHNEPLIRVEQGTVILRNLELKHVSLGIDIWNGNAAVQIQPPAGPDDRPMIMVPAPTVVMDHVEISSASGRGIVNIDGGQVTIRNCYVHDCAATGIYVGGPGSRAQIESTDVVRNGNGNTAHRRGIARGHSGVYLEQGHASIVDCNISQNSLTGISAVSPENAVLDLQESELVSNGSFQLEMPAVGTAAHARSNTSNNTLASNGLARSRSGLAMED